MAEHKFHSGPLAGQRIDRDDLPRHALEDGRWYLKLNGQEGTYVRDERSAGGRDWDWEDFV